jgi:hypothetical protein
MPATTGKTGGLNRKLGPFKLWVWGVGLLGAIAVGLYMRRRLAAQQSGQATAANTPAADTSGTAGGGSAGTSGDTTAADLSGITAAIQGEDQSIQALADSINSNALGAGGGGFDVGSNTSSDGSGDSSGSSSDSNATAPTNQNADVAAGVANAKRIYGHLTAEQQAANNRQVYNVSKPKGQPNKAHGRTGSAKPTPRKPAHPVTHKVIDHPAVARTLIRPTHKHVKAKPKLAPKPRRRGGGRPAVKA